MAMPTTVHDPDSLFPPYRNYAHAMEVQTGARLLVISGLNGYERDGTMPETFEEQAEVIWRHLEAVLADAGMTVANLISLRFYLADPADDGANVRILAKHLGEHRVPRTVVCARLLEPAWRLEVEAMAAA